ncbi:MAG: alpha/beta fold hydrolase [Cyanobacteria bacterium SZAS-4]|nr:alpha/beta fold hydrolase [Cyanobacteria bacterium SZAS-4]
MLNRSICRITLAFMTLSSIGQSVGATNASAPKPTSAAKKSASTAPAAATVAKPPLGSKVISVDAVPLNEAKDLPRSTKLAPVKDSAVQDQQKIPFVSWIDNSQPVDAVILCIHGLGLHKGTYEAFGKRMSKVGVPTYAMDMRGFGEWQDDLKTGLDFDGSLADIKIVLEGIKKSYPDKKIIILGESMGGAIALRATAMYPELISGLISSVPSGDRFGSGDTKLKVGLHGLLKGFNKPMNIGEDVVGKATKKEDLREAWSKDKLGRMSLTPKELMQFNSFMEKNFLVAAEIKNSPVLFMQGANDKLVHPEGTWKLFDSLTTDKRQMVFSKAAEHLIFEEAQFADEDLSFVQKWINKNVAPITALHIPTEKTETPVLATATDDTSKLSLSKSLIETKMDPTKGNDTQSAHLDRMNNAAQQVTSVLEKSGQTVAMIHPSNASGNGTGAATADYQGDPARISYWIELARDGKVYRCNNKTSFKSGDAIKFHIIAQTDGYAYVVMNKSSRGKSATLFPSAETGTNNFLTKGQDYPLPSKTWLKFDENPGTEEVSLVFSQKKIQPQKELQEQHYLTAYVSPSETGKKDLVPTRMQLSWDDPTPVIIPADFSGNTQLAAHSSLVNLSFNGPGGVLAVDIALAHQ